MSYEVDVLQTDIHESLLQVDSIIFDGFDKACSKYSGKFCNIVVKIEVRNEVTGLTALAGSNTTLTIYYTSIAHSPLCPVFFLNMDSIPSTFFNWLIVCIT